MCTLCYTCRFDRSLLETMSNSKMSMILMVRIIGMRDRWKKKYSWVGETLGWILIPYQYCLSKLQLSSFKVWVQPPFMASLSMWPLLMFLLTIPSIEFLIMESHSPPYPAHASHLYIQLKSPQGHPLSFLQHFICTFLLTFTTVYATFWIPNM